MRQIGQGVHELLSDKQTNKQTNREFYFMYIEDKDNVSNLAK